jgi:hypothetical protein
MVLNRRLYDLQSLVVVLDAPSPRKLIRFRLHRKEFGRRRWKLQIFVGLARIENMAHGPVINAKTLCVAMSFLVKCLTP